MSFAGFYFVVALLSAFGTFAAIVQGRRLYWALIPYFFAALLMGELAVYHLIIQISLTLLAAFSGALSDPLAQCGLGIFGLSWLGLLYLHCQAMDTPQFMKAALNRALGEDYRSAIPAERRALLRDGIVSREWMRPFNFNRDGVKVERQLSYGDAGKRNLFDIYHPVAEREGGYPILLQVHGGGWMIGNKDEQAKPLMYHMAQRGWLCVSINYRLSPRDAFPAHIIDVKKAIAWIRENIADYGGNPDFIAITGGSAGGHLTALAALTANDADWQPGFEEVDTRLQAAVPIYGVHDFLDRYNIRKGMSMEGIMANKVMQCKLMGNEDLWHKASPIDRVHEDAPPMLVVQGTHDSLVWVEEARAFVSTLQAVSREPVAYAELPGAQHAFELFHSVRTDHAVNGIADFLEWTHAGWAAREASDN